MRQLDGIARQTGFCVLALTLAVAPAQANVEASCWSY